MMPVIVPATDAHARSVIERLREADAGEAYALDGVSPEVAMRQSIEASSGAWAWLVDGEAAAIFGVAPALLIGNSGIPWLATTALLERRPLTFLRHTKNIVRAMLTDYDHLENVVDARHVVCLNWLRWAGFTVHPATVIGVQQLPFHRCEIRRTQWAG